MPTPDIQQLIVNLRLQDQLTGPLAAAKGELAATEATATQAAGAFAGLGSSMKTLALGLGTAFVAFKAVDFLGDAVKAAADEEAGIKRLTQSLQANVPAWQANEKAVEGVIAQRENLGFADDALRDSLGSLVAATHDVNAALDIQSTAMDLARFKGISLQEATQALVTIEAGRYRGLAQLGIVLKAGTTQAEALAAVQKVAGGQAEAFASTTQGAFDRASVAIHNLQETIGAPLLDALATVATAAAEAAKSLGQFVGTAEDLIAEAGKLGNAARDTGIRIPVLADAIDLVTGAFHAARDPAEQWFAAAKATGEAAAKSATQIPPLTDALKAAGGAAQQNSDFFRQFTTDAGETGAGLDQLQLNAIAAAHGLDTTHDSLVKTTTEASLLKFALDALPTNVDINVVTTFTNAQAGVGVVGGVTPGQDFSGSGGTVSGDRDKAARDLAERERLAREALARAKQRAQEEAAAYEKALNSAFDSAKKTANSLFDTLHDRITKAIDDAQNLAQKQHDAALQDISDNLKAAQSADAAPVLAAQKELRDRQLAEQRRDLVEALQLAQSGGDAKAIRSATEALQNFDAQQAIDRLAAVAATLDAAAQKTADAATQAADADLQAAKDKAQKDQDAETVASRKRKDDFEAALARLQAADLKAGKTPAQVQADIAALEKRFGITTDALGFHHIEDPLVTAIKGLRDTPPTLTVVNDQKFFLQLSGSQLRLIASAIQSNASRSASATVRTVGSGH